MKKQFVILLIAVLALVGFFLYKQVVKPQLDNRTVATIVPTPISNETLGFGFTYPSGETGFSMIEPPVPEGNTDGLQKVYLLMSTEDYIEYQQIEQMDTPPSVSVFVFTMPAQSSSTENLSRLDELKLWAETHSRYSSYSLRTTEPEIVKIDGVTGLSYATDSVYRQQVYLISYRNMVYVFTGQYQSEADQIREMFTGLISSVIFE